MHYVVKYRWKKASHDEFKDPEWHHDNEIIGEHPLEWLERTNLQNPQYTHVLDFWEKLDAPEIQIAGWKRMLS